VIAIARWAFCMAVLLSCQARAVHPGPSAHRAYAYLRVHASSLQDRSAIDPERVSVADDPSLLAVRWQAPDLIVLEYDSSKHEHGRSFRVRHPETCMALVDPLVCSTPQSAALLHAIVRTPQPIAQLGYDRAFSVGIEPSCESAAAGSIRWDFSGASDFAMTVTARAWTVRGRTPPLDPATIAAGLQGIVPRSPRTQGYAELRATITLSTGETVHRVVTVSAIGRATGVASIAPNHTVLLAGGPWSIVQRPPGAAAEIVAGPLATLQAWTPDRTGPWLMRRVDNQLLRVGVGRYDDMTLDCGRSECHAGQELRWRTSPMAAVLYRSVEGLGAAKSNVLCAVRCHAAGEPGLEDGGFWALASTLRTAIPHEGRADQWSQLPRALHHVSNVGCVSCHGSSILPSPDTRWTLLRADVCAHCHDSPPQYNQVLQWRASAMAHSDREPQTREGVCAQCHSTHEFLRTQGARTMAPIAPSTHESLGISCASCHSVHGQSADRSLRQVALRAWITGVQAVGERSQACVYCHSPTSETNSVEASSAALWLGVGGLDPRTGAALRAASTPHRGTTECVSCHRADAAGSRTDSTRMSHTFAASDASCAACHQREIAADRQSILRRAQTLYARFALSSVSATSAPPHASGATHTPSNAVLARALHNVLLVLEDRGAWAHNPTYATALLDAAERAAPRAL
jgi:hypothetical protein